MAERWHENKMPMVEGAAYGANPFEEDVPLIAEHLMDKVKVAREVQLQPTRELKDDGKLEIKFPIEFYLLVPLCLMVTRPPLIAGYMCRTMKRTSTRETPSYRAEAGRTLRLLLQYALLYWQLLDATGVAASKAQLRPYLDALEEVQTYSGRVVCAACQAESAVQLCSVCGCVGYCDRACQTAHWKEHKHECREMGRARAALGLSERVYPPPHSKGTHSAA